MEILNTIPKFAIKVATVALDEFVPDLTPTKLIAAIRNYDDGKRVTMTYSEACEQLGISIPTLIKLCDKGELRRLRIGGKVFIDRESFALFLMKAAEDGKKKNPSTT
jgi:excisionase family DNA binding protein